MAAGNTDNLAKSFGSVEQRIDSAIGEIVFESMKTKHPEGAWSLRKKCRQGLRPVYREIVLPVMRCITDLSYPVANLTYELV